MGHFADHIAVAATRTFNLGDALLDRKSVV